MGSTLMVKGFMLANMSMFDIGLTFWGRIVLKSNSKWTLISLLTDVMTDKVLFIDN